VRRIHPLPTILTLANLCSGFVAIVLAARSLLPKHPPIHPFGAVEGADLLWVACYCVFIAMIFDMLDGKVARMTGSASHFGAELDSLADVVSFGIAPAVILSVSRMHVEPAGEHWWSMAICMGFVYAACAALRLARFNVESDTTAKDTFRGLPSPGAAGAVTGVFLLVHDSDLRPVIDELLGGMTIHLLALYMLFIGLLMVTRVRYAHVTNQLLNGRKRFTHIVIALFALVLLWRYPAWVLAGAFNLYALGGVAGGVVRRARIWAHMIKTRRWRERRDERQASESGPTEDHS